MRRIRALLACAALAFSSAAWADFTGPVAAVVDGDTIDVLVMSHSVRIRFAQIDAPERSQAFGIRSRQALAAMVAGQVVTVAENDPDRYGRTLGTVFVGGVNVNAAMVHQGMAWAYRQYVTDGSLIQLEAEARAARRGLWADPAPVEPWLFRRTK